MISEQNVKHIAKLARLELSDGEIKKFTQQLGAILEYAEILKEVDTSGVEPIAQITGLTNIQDEDKGDACALGKELLKCSPQPIQNNMIKVKNVF